MASSSSPPIWPPTLPATSMSPTTATTAFRSSARPVPSSPPGGHQVPATVSSATLGIAANSTNVYVADTVNHRIQKFSLTGSFITTWGTSGAGNGQFAYPRDVACCRLEQRLRRRYQQRPHSDVQLVGGFITKWGTSGTGNSQFSDPYRLAADSSGRVHIGDQGNSRVQGFNALGGFITAFGVVGYEDGQFINNVGIANDPFATSTSPTAATTASRSSSQCNDRRARDAVAGLTGPAC